ncbi:MAG TPA: M20/M25/M40 family metallo-hydrolase, partial [Thermoanaerobaculia bacterium]|nr:M20/M25/M40 family metallo-hydrolase [Thermoanaerobaculia bacterium]
MQRALTVLLPLAVIFALAFWRADGPAPKGTTAPETDFSSARAMDVLQSLLAEGVPHPVGSEANRRVRERIEARFRALGFTTSVQRRFACNAGAVCAMVENVIARAPGPAQGDALVIASHYDSVGAGPGASDDGIGTAALLEIARAIRGERFRNPVVFLITDGEEAGLLGAEAFVADETLSRNVAAVVNVEMRGTYGASNMFETSRGNRWLIRHLAGALERPQASSLFYTIYNLLPNDTDVTVFKRAGKAAVNFGGIRGVNWYHTPLDDLAHASPRTLQHHGDNLLATLRVLANADLAARSKTDATYFDILGFFMVWWPQEWTIPMAVLSLLLLVFAARRTPPRGMTLGVLATFSAILLAAVGGFGVAALARLRSGGIHFVAEPAAAVAAMWLTGIAAALLSAALFNRRDDARAMLYGAAIVWHTIGIAVALTMPGAAFLFIVPAIAVTVCALSHADETVTASIASTVAALLLFPLGLLLYDALGGQLMTAVAIVLGIFTTLSAPLFARARNGLAAAVLAIVLGVIAMLQPAATAERPRALSLSYVDDPKAASPLWVVSRVTDSLQQAAPFRQQNLALTPWSGTDWTAPAPRQNLPRVTVEGTRTATGVTIRVRSPRRANRLVLLVRGASVQRVNGVPLPPRPDRFRDRMPEGWAWASAMGVEEMTVE